MARRSLPEYCRYSGGPSQSLADFNGAPQKVISALIVRWLRTGPNCIEHRPSWVVCTTSYSQEIPLIIWNVMFHYRAHNTPPLVLIQSQINLVRAPPPSYLLVIHFNVPPSTPRSSKLSLSLSITCLLTPWSRVLLEKLTGFAANQEIPRILWNPKVHYRTHKRPPPVLSWANSIQSPQPLPTSSRSILILSSHLRLGLPNGSFPQVSPPKPYAHLSLPPYLPHAPPISILLDFITRTILQSP